MERCKHDDCRKKAYSAMKCRCGNVYCSLHKPDTAHSCSYDYRAEHQRALTDQNPRIVAAKLKDPLTECNMPR